MSADKKMLPVAVPVDASHIPEELRRAKRWVAWMASWEGKKFNKRPGRHDRPGVGLNDWANTGWVDFDTALAAYEANREVFGGVGYVMSGRHGVTGVDLDHCIDKAGNIEPWAGEIIAKLDSYTERSPSGTGLRVFVAGDLDDWVNIERGIEVYGGGKRFLTVTGAQVAGSPNALRTPAPAVMDAIKARYYKDPRTKTNVEDLHLPDVLPDCLLHNVDDLDLPPYARNFLLDGPTPGDRSRQLFATAVALAQLDLPRQEVFSILANNDFAMEVAEDHWKGSHDKALRYLWKHSAVSGVARAEGLRQLQLDEFDDMGQSQHEQAAQPADQVVDIIDDFEILDPVDQQQVAAPAKAPRFTPVTPATFLLRKPASWIIKGVLPRAGLAVIYGASGSGKTFFTLDMTGAVVRGEPWRGQATQKGRGVYVVAEGASGFRNRLDAYCAFHGVDPAAFDLGVIADAPNLLDKGDMRDLIKALLAFGKVDFVVIDTYARAMAGGNENDAKDVGQAVAHCDVIHRKTGALVILVHHSGKDATRGARGSGALRAAADLELEVTQTREFRAVKVTKQKDGEDGKEYQFKLAEAVIGEDEDGDAITSCVVEHRENTARRPPGKGHTPRQEMILRVLDECMALDGSGVHYSDLKRLAVAQLPVDPEKKVDNRGRDVSRDIEHLVTTGCLQQNADGYLDLPVSAN